ncbi:hypothetical protein DFH05DRAFT_1538857 [Lentinula detonsa]|uniref:Uncharacterized protein n=1 Tax=Lentinula detonsa TaxID=2804962 RepID=A0A9W8PB17_9AGAR|nr:hypothetical protein DFH05DRAFT_1538857 [Lentinula detonsa]
MLCRVGLGRPGSDKDSDTDSAPSMTTTTSTMSTPTTIISLCDKEPSSALAARSRVITARFSVQLRGCDEKMRRRSYRTLIRSLFLSTRLVYFTYNKQCSIHTASPVQTPFASCSLRNFHICFLSSCSIVVVIQDTPEFIDDYEYNSEFSSGMARPLVILWERQPWTKVSQLGQGFQSTQSDFCQTLSPPFSLQRVQEFATVTGNSADGGSGSTIGHAEDHRSKF